MAGGATASDERSLSRAWRLSFSGATVALESFAGAEDCLVDVFAFVAPQIAVTSERAGSPEAAVRVVVRRYADFDAARCARGAPTLLKSATRPRYVIRAKRVRSSQGVDVLHTETTRTAYVLDAGAATATLYVDRASTIHVIEFLRGLMWTLAEGAGAVVLHAAGVTDRTGVVAIVGRKGTGKTTTLLDLIRFEGVEFFSGDKLFLGHDGTTVAAAGWPDFPHLGWGTILNHDRLAEGTRSLGLAASSNPAEKVVLPAAWYEGLLGFSRSGESKPVRGVVLSDLAAGGAKPRLARTEPVAGQLLHHFESREWAPPDSGWEPFFAAVRGNAHPTVGHRDLERLLLSVPWMRRTGRGRLGPDAEAVLRDAFAWTS